MSFSFEIMPLHRIQQNQCFDEEDYLVTIPTSEKPRKVYPLQFLCPIYIYPEKSSGNRTSSIFDDFSI